MKNLLHIFAILFNLFISFIAASTKHTSTLPEKILFDLKYLVCSAQASTSKKANFYQGADRMKPKFMNAHK